MFNCLHNWLSSGIYVITPTSLTVAGMAIFKSPFFWRWTPSSAISTFLSSPKWRLLYTSCGFVIHPMFSFHPSLRSRQVTALIAVWLIFPLKNRFLRLACSLTFWSVVLWRSLCDHKVDVHKHPRRSSHPRHRLCFGVAVWFDVICITPFIPSYGVYGSC